MTMAVQARWFYTKDGRQLGAGFRDAVIDACTSGEIDATSLLWDRLQLAWIRVSDSEFRDFLNPAIQ
jgi:hypothetical protein